MLNYPEMMKKVGETKMMFCKKCDKDTNWRFIHKSYLAGPISFFGFYWHEFIWECDNGCGNDKLVHKEKRWTRQSPSKTHLQG